MAWNRRRARALSFSTRLVKLAGRMFANLLQLITRRTPPDYARGFVKGVSVHHPVVRHRRVERVLLACWLLIVAKSWLVIWAVEHYHIPVNPLWVIAPTVAFAAVCTAVYIWRD